MKQTKVGNLPLYQFDLFEKYPEILAIVSTRLGGVSEDHYAELNLGLHVGDEHDQVLKNRDIFARAIGIDPEAITCGEQTHETDIQVVKNGDKGRGATDWQDGFAGTDAMITNALNVPLAVLTADCAGIFLFDPVKKAVGIAHSGRKGTEDEITIKTIQKMHDVFGTCAEDIIAGIGSCIYPCCYEIDLPNLIINQLLEAGVKKGNIESSGLCTSCYNDIFYSYRARGGYLETGRFMNLIMLS